MPSVIFSESTKSLKALSGRLSQAVVELRGGFAEADWPLDLKVV